MKIDTTGWHCHYHRGEPVRCRACHHVIIPNDLVWTAPAWTPGDGRIIHHACPHDAAPSAPEPMLTTRDGRPVCGEEDVAPDEPVAQSDLGVLAWRMRAVANELLAIQARARELVAMLESMDKEAKGHERER